MNYVKEAGIDKINVSGTDQFMLSIIYSYFSWSVSNYVETVGGLPVYLEDWKNPSMVKGRNVYLTKIVDLCGVWASIFNHATNWLLVFVVTSLPHV